MNVLITELMWPDGIQLLKEVANVEYAPDLWQERAALLSKVTDVDALIVRNQTKVDQKLLAHAKNLKVVGRLGVGLDNINVDEARNYGVNVVYARNANAISVAEYVMTAILSISRTLNEADISVKHGQWNRRLFTGSEVYNKMLGLVGVGEIAHRIAKRATAFGMNVLGYDPFVTEYDFPVAETGITLTTFETLLSTADFISIHVPLLPETKNLFKAEQFAKMKPSSCLINTSRGGIVNEADLNTALENKQIAKAILDVLEVEPPAGNHPLLKNDNVIITPHIAGLTEQSQRRTSRLVANDVIKVLKHERPLSQV